MERHFDEELAELKKNILEMGSLAEEAIFNSIESLKQRSKIMANDVIENDKIIDEMEGKDLSKVKDKYFQYPQTKYLPLRPPNITILKAHEVKMIDEVLNKLSDMNASEIRDYSHGDVPWLTTEDGKVIDYESVFYRTAPYSVRLYSGKDIQ